jgi:FkbM family methyltransferase
MKSLVRQCLTPRMRDAARRVLGRSDPWGITEQTLEELTQLPRYQHTKIRFFGNPLQVCDAASFLSAWKEIFQAQIYRFHAQTPAPLIIDAGANLGLASIYLSRLYPSARIIAVESDPEIFSLLQANLSAQGVHAEQVLCRAVWDSNETLRFSQDRADAGRVAGAGTVEVQGLRLRDLLRKFGSVEFLKLDIEGAEVRVLQDCRDSLAGVQRLFVEYHSQAGQSQQLAELLEVLQSSGFRYYIQHCGVCNLTPLAGLQAEAGFDLQLNIWGIRQQASAC